MPGASERGARCLMLFGVIAYSVVLTIVALMPISRDSVLAATATRRIINNLLHVPAYGVLAWLWIVQFRTWLGESSGFRYLVAGCGAAAALGAATELAQGLVPGRKGTMGDLLLNFTGIGIVALLAWLRGSVRRRLQARG